MPSITKVLPARLPEGRSVSSTSAPSLIALPGLRKRHDPVFRSGHFSLGVAIHTSVKLRDALGLEIRIEKKFRVWR